MSVVRSNLTYRPEIDGLRAIAVVLVVMYHAGLGQLGGGFVGVDVFFVISGYLITTILISDLHAGAFSLKSFYERRAKRLLPALFVMLAISVPFAWLWLPASDMQDYSQSILSTLFFGSNILFWLESGYFDADSQLKPLLHTWSLGVEEQFYLVFPVLLLVAWRLFRKRIAIVIGTSALLSLTIAEWAVRGGGPVAGFYLLPTRFWELALGALVALLLRRRASPRGSILVELLGWFGLSLVAFSAVAFDNSTSFPGLSALIPTGGTALVIIFASADTSLGKLLRTRGLVSLGVMSYSLYLYHYPVFSFSKRLFPDGASALLTAFLLCLSFLLAYVSWKFIETPWRVGQNQSISRFARVATGVFASVGLLAVGLWGHLSDGFPGHIILENQLESAEIVTDTSFIVIGDSHADDLRRGLDAISSGEVRDMTSPGCIPLRNVDRYDYRSNPGDCADTINTHFDLVIAEDPDAVVVLLSMGPVYLDGTGFNGKTDPRVEGLGVTLITEPNLTDRWKVFEAGLRTTFGEMSGLRNARAIFVIDWPELPFNNGCNNEPKSIQLGPVNLNDTIPTAVDCRFQRELYDSRADRYRTLVASVASDFPSIQVLDPTSLFCDDRLCRGTDSADNPWYRDDNHLNGNGSVYVAGALVEHLHGKEAGSNHKTVGAEHTDR